MNIIMLHDIRPFDKNFFPNRYKKHSFITDIEFINGLNSLNGTIINPDTLLEDNLSNISGNILTFDDGLKDHLRVAEILVERNIKAIFFIPFGIINSKNFIDSHIIQFLIADVDNILLAQEIYDFLLKNKVAITDIESYKNSRWKNNVWSKEEIFITRTLRESMDPSKRNNLLISLAKKHLNYHLDELHDIFYLSFNDIENIFSMGHQIGSHGYNSIDLRFVDDFTVQDEIENSYNFLNKYKTDIVPISYANGGFNDKVQDIVTRTGYNFGFGTQHESINSTHELLHLPRLDGTKMNIFI